jgi:hypothetical protein
MTAIFFSDDDNRLKHLTVLNSLALHLTMSFRLLGKGSFNWRLLFDVELGHGTRAMKFPYLHIQVILTQPRSFVCFMAFYVLSGDLTVFMLIAVGSGYFEVE